MQKNAMADGGAKNKEAATSGAFGEGCIWSLGSDGTLIVSPEDGKSGTMSEVRPEMPGSLADKAARVVIAKGVKAPQNAWGLFARMSAATSIDAADLDISGTRGMNSMFSGCASLTDISSLSSWDVSQVHDMGLLFDGCTSLTDISSLSSWDVSQVHNMTFMFRGCSSLEDLSPLSSWDISHTRIMDGMFMNCTSLTDSSPLSSWDISGVAMMHTMFLGCTGLAGAASPWQEWIDATVSGACGDGCAWELDGKGTLTISPADGESGTLSWLPAHLLHRTKRVIIAKGVKAPRDARSLFAGMSAVTSIDAADLDISGTRIMGKMFSGCASLKDISSLSSWDISQVWTMAGMFDGCASLKDISSLSSWDISQVHMMGFMFMNCTSLADLSPLSAWDVSQIDNMEYMFYGCTSLADATPLEAWKVQKDAVLKKMLPQGCAAPSWLKQGSSTEQ